MRSINLRVNPIDRHRLMYAIRPDAFTDGEINEDPEWLPISDVGDVDATLMYLEVGRSATLVSPGRVLVTSNLRYSHIYGIRDTWRFMNHTRRRLLMSNEEGEQLDLDNTWEGQHFVSMQNYDELLKEALIGYPTDPLPECHIDMSILGEKVVSHNSRGTPAKYSVVARQREFTVIVDPGGNYWITSSPRPFGIPSPERPK